MKCFISVVHQYCNDLRIGRSAIPEGSILLQSHAWRTSWFLASFGGGSCGCSRSFHFVLVCDENEKCVRCEGREKRGWKNMLSIGKFQYQVPVLNVVPGTRISMKTHLNCKNFETNVETCYFNSLCGWCLFHFNFFCAVYLNISLISLSYLLFFCFFFFKKFY